MSLKIDKKDTKTAKDSRLNALDLIKGTSPRFHSWLMGLAKECAIGASGISDGSGGQYEHDSFLRVVNMFALALWSANGGRIPTVEWAQYDTYLDRLCDTEFQRNMLARYIDWEHSPEFYEEFEARLANLCLHTRNSAIAAMRLIIEAYVNIWAID
ncbi:MAG: hypothetical protein Q7S37_01835 [bacterium]|nr:hypothetical protein [bacterium]